MTPEVHGKERRTGSEGTHLRTKFAYLNHSKKNGTSLMPLQLNAAEGCQAESEEPINHLSRPSFVARRSLAYGRRETPQAGNEELND